MRTRFMIQAAAWICAAVLAAGTAARAIAADSEQKVRVVLTTGGHDFEEKPFREMWDSFKSIVYREVKMGKTAEAFTPENLKDCDVLATYDMAQNGTAFQGMGDTTPSALKTGVLD